MSDQKKSAIKRSWPATFGYLIAAAVCFGIAAALFKFTSGGSVIGAVALTLLLVMVILLYFAFAGAAACACPACGASLGGLKTGKNDGIYCGKCQRYFEGAGGEMWATDESRIAARPLFASSLPKTIAFPEGCCVCGQPSTHGQRISMANQNASNAAVASVTGVQSVTRTSVEVPHCDEHKDGAMLYGTTRLPRIMFRSYPYQRAFCELNKTTP